MIAFREQRLKGAGGKRWSLITLQQKEVFRQPDKFYYQYAYHLGIAVEEPSLEAACIEDKNGHILPYVTFKGGRLKLAEEALNILREHSR